MCVDVHHAGCTSQGLESAAERATALAQSARAEAEHAHGVIARQEAAISRLALLLTERKDAGVPAKAEANGGSK